MKRILLLVGIAWSGWLHAQPEPFGLSVDRNQVRIQQPVKVLVNYGDEGLWCGLRIDLGDGDVRDLLLDGLPLTLTKQYAAAGRYVLRAQGHFVARGVKSALGCGVAARSLTVVVGERAVDAPDPGSATGSRGGQGQREARRERDQLGAEFAREREEADAQAAREQRKRDAELARERDKREQELRRETPNRDARVANVPAPVPPAPLPPGPAPAASKPRDGTLKVF